MGRINTGALAALLIAAGAASASADLAKQLTIAPGKGVSFYMGSQQGTAMFTPLAGACELKVTITHADNSSGMSGMAGGMSATSGGKSPMIKIQVMPARPAEISTPDGQQLVFNCGPDAKEMFLDMPSGFKYTEK